MKTPMTLASLSVPELLGLYRTILSELWSRGVIRSWNAPTGDYAEYLLAAHYGVVPEPNSNKSFDLVTGDGTRIQVKARIVTDPRRRGDRQLSTIRTWGFDLLAVVLFANDYSIWRAVLVPREVAEVLAIFGTHVNGYRLDALDPVLDRDDVVDITAELRITVDGLST